MSNIEPKEVDSSVEGLFHGGSGESSFPLTEVSCSAFSHPWVDNGKDSVNPNYSRIF